MKQRVDKDFDSEMIKKEIKKSYFQKEEPTSEVEESMYNDFHELTKNNKEFEIFNT